MPLKAALWSIFIILFQRFISLITLPVFTRVMNIESYGSYLVYSSWLTILSIFCTLNLSYGVFNKTYLKFESSNKQVIPSFQLISLLSTITTFIIIYIITSINKSLVNLDTDIIIILFIELLFLGPTSLWLAKEKHNFEYKKVLIYSIAVGFMIPLINIISILIFSDQFRAKIISSAIINVIMGLLFLISNVKNDKMKIDFSIIRYALWFNLPLIPHYLSTIVLSQADRIMIDYYIDSTKAAIYGVSYTIGSLVLIIITGLNASYIPWQYKKLKNLEYDKIKNITKYINIMVFASIVISNFIAPELLFLLASKEYNSGLSIIPVITSSVLFIYFGNLFSNVEFYFEKRYFSAIASLIAATTNILLNLYFIPHWGIFGAAITTLISYLIYFLMHLMFSKNIIGINHIYPISQTILMVIGVVLISILSIYLYMNDLVFIRIFLFFLTIIIILILILKNRYKVKKNHI
jgi:O-antigen/teichoic acid export membrane protein